MMLCQNDVMQECLLRSQYIRNLFYASSHNDTMMKRGYLK